MVATRGRHGGCNSEMVAARSSLLTSGELDKQGYEQNRVPYQFQCVWLWVYLAMGGDPGGPRRIGCRDSLATFVLFYCASHVGTTDSCCPFYVGRAELLVSPLCSFKGKKNRHCYNSLRFAEKLWRKYKSFLCDPLRFSPTNIHLLELLGSHWSFMKSVFHSVFLNFYGISLCLRLPFVIPYYSALVVFASSRPCHVLTFFLMVSTVLRYPGQMFCLTFLIRISL